MRRPSAVLFDIGDTLLLERRFDLVAGIEAAVPHLTRQAPALAASFRAVLRAQHSQDREPLLARWLSEHVQDLADRPIEGIEDAIWPAVVTLELSPGVDALLGQLHTAGVLLGAVSNAYFSGRVLEQELRHQGLNDFAFVLTSGDAGWRKPSAAIFDIALRQAGVTASDTWFVGDTYHEDIVGAARAGLTTVWMRADTTTAPEHDHPSVRNWTDLGALLADSAGR